MRERGGVIRPSGENPAKRRHHQTEMLKVHSLKDGALNSRAGLLLGRHVCKRKASRQLQGSGGRLQGEALMDRRQRGQRAEPHVLKAKQLVINQSAGHLSWIAGPVRRHG